MTAGKYLWRVTNFDTGEWFELTGKRYYTIPAAVNGASAQVAEIVRDANHRRGLKPTIYPQVRVEIKNEQTGATNVDYRGEARDFVRTGVFR